MKDARKNNVDSEAKPQTLGNAESSLLVLTARLHLTVRRVLGQRPTIVPASLGTTDQKNKTGQGHLTNDVAPQESKTLFFHILL